MLTDSGVTIIFAPPPANTRSLHSQITVLIHNSGHFGPPLPFWAPGTPRHCRGYRWLVTPLLTEWHNRALSWVASCRQLKPSSGRRAWRSWSWWMARAALESLITECLQYADASGCGGCEICRRLRAPNLETKHGHLVADALFRRATNAVSRVEASHEFVMATNVRRILVRGSMRPCRLRRTKLWKFDYEMAHSEVYLNKYVISIAPFSTPACLECSQNIT